MSGQSGYYLMHRGWMDNPAFLGSREPFCRRAAWIWLVENAAWRDTRIDVSGRTSPVNRGQISVSYRTLAETWGWGLKAVRVFIDRLKSDTLIDTDMGTGRMLITLCNYDVYQTSIDDKGTARDTAQGTAGAQQGHREGTQKKEGNTSKKRKRESSTLSISGADDEQGSLLPTAQVVKLALKPTVAAEFTEFWDAYPRKVGKDAARRAFATAVRKGAVPADILQGLRRQRFGAEKRFMPHPATWLNAGRWTDVVEDVSPPATPRPGRNDWANQDIHPDLVDDRRDDDASYTIDAMETA